ncbi:MAG: toll/interleukin-1 receptor domain-containing protein [Candidatus Sulfotelmatobacter sp.]
MNAEIKNYASSLYEKASMESVKRLQEERATYLAKMAQRSMGFSLLGGSEIKAIVDLHVMHIERSMSARLESYRQAFTEANQTPTDHDFNTILDEAQRTREQQARHSAAAVRNFIASRGSARLPPGAEASAINQIMSNSGHGHDRVLREWKIWRDKVRLLKSTAVHSAHNSSVRRGVASDGGSNMKSVFISYSWDDDQHCEWVRKLAERLRADGVDVSIDRWAAVPGDQLPGFMERAIRENGFVVIVCTPRYKIRSDSREGGVGYEGDIMTAEVMTSNNHRKFIPVLRKGAWSEAAPSWLLGKYYINLAGDPYSERDYEDLVRTLLGIRETAPPIGKPMATISPSATQESQPPQATPGSEFEDIKITRVIVEDITEPRKDGTYGSALYSVPFALSRTPPPEWGKLFIENWNHPPRFTTMHRPGIAKIYGAAVTLDGTSIEEVERYHRDTLQLVVAETNKQYRDLRGVEDGRKAREEAGREQRRKNLEDASKRIKFD